MYLEKPSQISVTLANTIFGALRGERLVDLTVVIHNIVLKLGFGTRNLLDRHLFAPFCFTSSLPRAIETALVEKLSFVTMPNVTRNATCWFNVT